MKLIKITTIVTIFLTSSFCLSTLISAKINPYYNNQELYKLTAEQIGKLLDSISQEMALSDALKNLSPSDIQSMSSGETMTLYYEAKAKKSLLEMQIMLIDNLIHMFQQESLEIPMPPKYSDKGDLMSYLEDQKQLATDNFKELSPKCKYLKTSAKAKGCPIMPIPDFPGMPMMPNLTPGAN